MSNERTSRDFLIDRDAEASRVEIEFMPKAVPQQVKGVKEYDDAELYRIIVAKALREGRFNDKAEFDAAARALGTVEQADEVIAFRRLRPDCDAWRRGDLMVCDCGAFWKVDVADPPHCKKMHK